MAMLCICGVCIPYSALLPLIAFLFRFMAKPFSKIMEWIENVLPWATGPKTESSATKVAAPGISTSQNTNLTVPSTTCCRQDIVEENINNSGRLNEVVTCIKSMEQWEDHHAKYETVICKFTASWCKPCKKIEPSFQLFAEEYHRSRTDGKNISFVKVDVDEMDVLASKYNVCMMPTFIVFKKREKYDSMAGSDVNKLEQFTRKHVSTETKKNC